MAHQVRIENALGADITLNFQDAGTGMPVVLVHGFTGNHRFFLRVASTLVSAGHRAISVDLRGHGASEKPADRNQYSIPILAADVLGLIGHLRIDKCVLLGHSMGAYVALELALRFPESISGLVIVDSGYGRRYATEQEGLARLALMERIAEEDGMDGLFEFTWGHLPYRNAAHRQSAKRLFMETTVDAYLGCQYGMQEWGSHLDSLPEIMAPTLLIAADNGTNIKSMREMEEMVPTSELVIIDGTGHNVFLDKPHEFNTELVRFLRPLVM